MGKTGIPPDEMLLAIFKYKYSLSILQEEGWYHIPVNRAPRVSKRRDGYAFIRAKYLEMMPTAFNIMARLKGIKSCHIASYSPTGSKAPKSDWPYYKVRFEGIETTS